jgi:hypothetical protein
MRLSGLALRTTCIHVRRIGERPNKAFQRTLEDARRERTCASGFPLARCVGVSTWGWIQLSSS